MLQASPYKLKNGSWGARVQGIPTVGDQIQITTRSGKSWTASVARILWTGDGISLVATQESGRRSGGWRRLLPDRCRGCRGPIVDAPHHRAMEGYCGGCAFDEFDGM